MPSEKRPIGLRDHCGAGRSCKTGGRLTFKAIRSLVRDAAQWVAQLRSALRNLANARRGRTRPTPITPPAND